MAPSMEPGAISFISFYKENFFPNHKGNRHFLYFSQGFSTTQNDPLDKKKIAEEPNF